MARGVTPDAADYDRRTALHLAAAEGHAAVVKVLLAQGCNPEARDRWGATPGQDARLHGHTDIVSLLEAAAATAA